MTAEKTNVRSLNPKLLNLFAEYANDHQHPKNRLTHKIAIPIIVFHIIAMADWVKFGTIPGSGSVQISGAHILLLCAYIYYFRLHHVLTGWMVLGTVPLYFLARQTPRPLIIVLAIAGWIIQFAGHYVFEKKSPSFFTNILQALIGPFFFLAILLGIYPVKNNQS
jgi:uncharacterized membrane protein YGL010W